MQEEGRILTRRYGYGRVFRERHLTGHHADGTKKYTMIWTAEVCIGGHTYRKKSKNVEICTDWLDKVRDYLEGRGEFPARLRHPGEAPVRMRQASREHPSKD